VIFTLILLRSHDHARRVARSRRLSAVVSVVIRVTPVAVPGSVSVAVGVRPRRSREPQLERAA
jgi:hypothetical protein